MQVGQPPQRKIEEEVIEDHKEHDAHVDPKNDFLVADLCFIGFFVPKGERNRVAIGLHPQVVKRICLPHGKHLIMVDKWLFIEVDTVAGLQRIPPAIDPVIEGGGWDERLSQLKKQGLSR